MVKKSNGAKTTPTKIKKPVVAKAKTISKKASEANNSAQNLSEVRTLVLDTLK